MHAAKLHVTSDIAWPLCAQSSYSSPSHANKGPLTRPNNVVGKDYFSHWGSSPNGFKEHCRPSPPNTKHSPGGQVEACAEAAEDLYLQRGGAGWDQGLLTP